MLSHTLLYRQAEKHTVSITTQCTHPLCNPHTHHTPHTPHTITHHHYTPSHTSHYHHTHHTPHTSSHILTHHHTHLCPVELERTKTRSISGITRCTNTISSSLSPNGPGRRKKLKRPSQHFFMHVDTNCNQL